MNMTHGMSACVLFIKCLFLQSRSQGQESMRIKINGR